MDSESKGQITVVVQQQLQMLAKNVDNVRCAIGNPALYRQYFSADTDRWSRFCVAIDTLEDTLLAIEAFVMNDPGHTHQEQYLRFYGLMQAVYIQEDAISELWTIVMESKLEKPDDDSGWMTIRNIRNHSAGHPVDRRISLVRVNLEAGFVSMITSVPEGRTSMEYGEKHWGGKLADLLTEYVKEADDRLSAIAARIPIKWTVKEK
jgi:hypothetical protein